MADNNGTTEPDVQTRYRDVRRASQAAQSRLDELRQKVLGPGLTVSEEFEQLGLERRLSNLAPVLENLRKAATHESVVDIVEAYADGVDAAVPEMHAAFDNLMEHLAYTKAAFDRLCALVQLGEQRTVHLPNTMQEKLNYPSVPAVQTNLATCLGVDLRMLNEITPVRREAARDILPDSRPANRIALQRWLNEHKERLYREAGRGN